MRIIPSGRIKRLHVNSHTIQSNKKGGADPVLTCRMSDGPRYSGSGEEQRIDVVYRGEVICSLRYLKNKPLSCGATCWVETTREIHIHGVDDEV